ncbi:MAG: hypothetical protein ACP5H8_01130 [Candidatus Micrarchaeia archaeon]
MEKITHREIYITALIIAIAFIILRIDLLAIVSALLFITGVVFESMLSAKEKGVKHELKEVLIAICAALVLWFGASILLNTPSPFNAVVSCSMLNTLQRGDVVVLVGGQNINTAEVNLTKKEFDEMVGSNEIHYVCGYCKQEDNGYTTCAINPYTGARAAGKILNYECSVCTQEAYGKERQIPCVRGVWIKDTYVNVSKKEGDIIVYRPKTTDVFASTGDIIHRAIVKINVEDKRYYLIKGDNNNMFDVQMFDTTLRQTNDIADEGQILGRSVLVLPFLGYIKLVAAGQIANPENCYTLLKYEN